MKRMFLLCVLFCLMIFSTVFAQQRVKVNRWVSPVFKDFISIPENKSTDAQLISFGYKDKIFQYEAFLTIPAGNNVAVVNRWSHPNCGDFIIIAEHEISDQQMTSFGYVNKQFLFYAYKTRPANGAYVAVSRWINTLPVGNPCRDFSLSIAEHELTDTQLTSWGYTNKMVQFYVPDPRQKTNASTTITLTDIDEWLCPQAVLRGDREFDGHGPRIKCEVTLSIGDAGKALYADIYFWAQETIHDWSTTERRWRKKVYDAPYGKTITAISSDKASRTQFISPAGGFQFLVPGNDVASVVNGFLDGAGGTISRAVLASHGIPSGDFRAVARLITGAINSGNTVVRVPALEGTLVKFFHIVGDTGGADISDDDNCNDDTRIVKLEFNPVTVTFR